MVLVMKLSAFCWNVHDGRLSASELSSSQKHAAIVELPSALDYAGYVLFFPSLFGGPAFDYNDFRRWIDTSMFDTPPDVDPSKVPPTRKKRKIPRSGTPAAKKAAIGLIWIFAFLQFGSWFYADAVISDDFMSYGFLRRVWMLYMLGVTTRMKYYGVWSLAEGSCILSGLGYNGFDPKTGRVSWNKLENINAWNVETAQNSHAYLGNWNKNTNYWLRNYVYLRVTPKGKKPGFRASLATFATSAFWHGFYPGYYLSFILASFIQTAAKSTFTSLFDKYIYTLSYNSPFSRIPPSRPSILPNPGRHCANCIQTLLRLHILASNPIHLRLHRIAIRRPRLQRLHPRLGQRLLLRHHQRLPLPRLLRQSRRLIPRQETKRT